MMRQLTFALLLAACSNTHHGVDAPPADVSTDTIGAGDGEPPANAVKLAITRGGFPAVGIAVVFQAADSSLVLASLTNDKGIAWAELAGGGFVTAFDHVGANLDELTTFAGVQPADALTLDLDPSGSKDEWPVTISIPADPGAAGYRVFTTCGGPIGVEPAAGTPTTLVGCGGMADAVVVTEDDAGDPLRAFFAGNVVVPQPPPPPETDAMPPVFPGLPLAGSYAALAPTTFSYSNVPATVTFVATFHAFASAHGRVYERTAGEAPSGGSVQTSILVPAASAPTLVATNLFSQQVGIQTIYEARAAAGAYALDVGASLLPPFASAPSFDAGSVTWMEGAAPVQPDLVRARIHVYRDAVPTGRSWGWRMVAPRSGTQVTYPQLPSFGFDFNPASGDIVGVSELMTAAVPGDYAAVRRIAFGDLTSLVIGTTERGVIQMLNSIEP
jgi:hypothetical protein